jgi:hypothetical protein
MWVATGQHLQPWPTVKARETAMHVIWEMVYYEHFSDKSRYAEGWDMVSRWVQRTDWSNREVLSTEVKETFELPTSIGKLPMTYIFDRCDRRPGDSIEVIDYKTVALPIQPEELRQRIQPRFYAVAAMMKYPWASSIWVTYDLLRYEQVSMKFTRDDNVETWRYMRAMAERIIASDGTEEQLNSECRWCVRKHECDTLSAHGLVGGILGDDIQILIQRRAKMEMALHGLQAATRELDRIILDHCEEENLLSISTDEVDLKVTASSRRHIDPERVVKIIGPEMMAKYGNIGVTQVDTILKNETSLTDSQKSLLKQCFTREYGNPRIETNLKSPFSKE